MKLYWYGDVNKNENVEAQDALLILQHVVHLKEISDPIAMELADANHDKSINASDALTVLRMVVMLAPKESVAAASKTSSTCCMTFASSS